MIVAQFDPDSPEAEAAMRCAEETVIIPGYGTVDRAQIDKLDGVITCTVHFRETPPGEEFSCRSRM